MRATRNIRKTLDLVANHNEDAALALMRTADRTSDQVLQQQLFNLIHRLNQDACDLRSVREHLEARRA